MEDYRNKVSNYMQSNPRLSANLLVMLVKTLADLLVEICKIGIATTNRAMI